MGLRRSFLKFIEMKKRNYIYSTHQKNDNLFEYHLPKQLMFEADSLINAKEVIYCFWTGSNEMPVNRKAAYEKLVEISDCEVKLITSDNLHNYILDDYPLHSAYENLSCVHRADYLRCYFMHHHGGGYSDVKGARHSWKELFKKLNGDSEKIALGFPEQYSDWVAYSNDFLDGYEFGSLNRDMKKHFPYLIGNCAYIFKPKSVFTTLWIEELHRRLDIVNEDLISNPGNVWGDNEGYPLPWNSILGQIFHPLSLIYYRNIIRDERILPDLKNYR